MPTARELILRAQALPVSPIPPAPMPAVVSVPRPLAPAPRRSALEALRQRHERAARSSARTYISGRSPS